MKLPLLALVCLLITSSCKKEIDYHQEWDLSTMSAKVDGALLQCTLATAQVYDVDEQISVQISGKKGTTTGFSLMISDFKGVAPIIYRIITRRLTFWIYPDYKIPILAIHKEQ